MLPLLFKFGRLRKSERLVRCTPKKGWSRSSGSRWSLLRGIFKEEKLMVGRTKRDLLLTGGRQTNSTVKQHFSILYSGWYVSFHGYLARYLTYLTIQRYVWRSLNVWHDCIFFLWRVKSPFIIVLVCLFFCVVIIDGELPKRNSVPTVFFPKVSLRFERWWLPYITTKLNWTNV